MDILVLNSGSSSLKFQVVNPETEEVVIVGLFEEIGSDRSKLKYEFGDEEEDISENFSNHDEAVKKLFDLLGEKVGLDRIKAIGHRVVHGGELYSESCLIDDDVIKAIDELKSLAPLHNPANLSGILACKKIMPELKQVAVFDTAFHQTMDEAAFRYAVPKEYYDKYKVRKYGFHGTSHKYIAEKVEELFGKGQKIISCHLGNGASLCAIKDGQSIETSMGFTPLPGLIMGTRCGDLDPEVVNFLMEKENLTNKEISTVLNKKSGLKGICGESDFRPILAEMNSDHDKKLALDMYAHRVKSFIGSYTAALNGTDIIVFTAGAGENGTDIRKALMTNLEGIGIEFDDEKNQNARSTVKSQGHAVISKDSSKVKVVIIPTNEEVMIAKDTKSLI